MMPKHAWLFAAALALVVPAAPAAWAAEEVDAAKVAERAIDSANPDNVDPLLIKGEKWTFDFRFENPEPIVVDVPGSGKQLYWYLVYTVTNRTGAEHYFVPAFTLYASNTSLQRAGVYPTVFDAIRKQRKIRFLENAVQMIGKVLPGEDNARTGVAIFGPMPRETEDFTIFVEGLSGQYIEQPAAGTAPAPAPAKPDAAPPAPAAKPAAPAPAKTESPAAAKPAAPVTAGAESPVATKPPAPTVIILRKTLALAFKLPGDKWWLNQDPPVFAKKWWTWR
jgi:hypothetical protein